MDAVIEIDEARQVVHSDPLNGSSSLEALSDRLQHRAVGPNLAVAIHADFGGRNARKSRLFYSGVAITTVDPVVAHMVFVTEGYGLHPGDAHLRDIRGSVDGRNGCHKRAEKNDATEDTYLGNSIRAGMEYLGHQSMTNPNLPLPSQ